MIHRFATLSEALTFMNESKLKGHYAEILHFHAGHIWCETTTLGFPVLVSEEMHDEMLEEEMKVYWLPRCLMNGLTLLFVITMTLMILWLIFVLSYNVLLLSSLFPSKALKVTLALLIIITVYTYLMNLLYSSIREVKESNRHSFFYYLFYLPLTTLLMLITLFF